MIWCDVIWYDACLLYEFKVRKGCNIDFIIHYYVRWLMARFCVCGKIEYSRSEEKGKLKRRRKRPVKKASCRPVKKASWRPVKKASWRPTVQYCTTFLRDKPFFSKKSLHMWCFCFPLLYCTSFSGLPFFWIFF